MTLLSLDELGSQIYFASEARLDYNGGRTLLFCYIEAVESAGAIYGIIGTSHMSARL